MPAVADVGRVRVRKSAAGPQGGGVFVPVLQRARLLDATIGLVLERRARLLEDLAVTIDARPGLNNREISDRAGVSDQGQMSRLLWRLEDQGLLENTGGHAQATPKAWSLTALGEQALLQASPPHDAGSESV
jgi:DNA-binding MarR family transcriptional regulator